MEASPNPKEDPFNREEIYRRLVEEAPFIPVSSEEDKLDGEKIPWLNPKLIREGQEFASKHAFSVGLAHLLTNVSGFAYKPVSTLLARTESYEGVQGCLNRIEYTRKHVQLWYKTDADLISKYGDGSKSLKVVRKLHALVFNQFKNKDYVPDDSKILDKKRKEEIMRAMQSDLSWVTAKCPGQFNTYNPDVLMSQADFAFVQFGLFAFAFINPGAVGISDTEGVEGFIHLWAVLGRLLGLEDRFNLALYPDAELYHKIFDNIFLPLLAKADLKMVDMQVDLSKAVAIKLNMLSSNFLLYFSLRLSTAERHPQFKGEELYKLLSFTDKIGLKAFDLVLACVYHSNLFRGFMRWVHSTTE